MERKSGSTLETSTVEQTMRKQEGIGGPHREVDVTLDLDTANPLLIVSEDLKSVRRGNRVQCRPDNPKRFETVSCVLGCEGFTSGKHSWEVEVEVEKDQVLGGLGWAVGVARESVRRKGLVYACPREGIWVVGKVMPYGLLAFTSPEDNLSILNHEPKKIQVSLDYKGGRVDFFDADTGDLIFTFPSALFSGERLRPYFRMEWLGQLKCRRTDLGRCQRRQASPGHCCPEVQGHASRFGQYGRMPQTTSRAPCTDPLCGSPPPTFPECSENRNLESYDVTKPESPNVTESRQHSGLAWPGQSVPHSVDCMGLRPAAEARRSKGRQNYEDEEEKMFPLKLKSTSSLGAGDHTEPGRVEEEETGAAVAWEPHPPDHDAPPLEPEGSSEGNWEGTLLQGSPSYEEKGRGVSLKEERDSAGHERRDTWLNSENYPLFALISFLSVLIITIYDLLS
ncbi:UNVERIFIED_CONTAM: hypothetical protein K2H54_061080 [Gekko kuhli]